MMQTPRVRIAALLAACAILLPGAAPPARAAAETAEAVEKDLAAVFQRMDAMKTELDRIEELVATPKATMLRVEIMGDGTTPAAPVSARFLVGGKVEDEREWSKIERESYADRHVPMPLVFVIPYLPGDWAARLEVQNPAWKTPPSFDFQAAMRKGETTTLRLRLGTPAGKADPVLTRAPEPVAPKAASPGAAAPAKGAGK
jgi:hypothetical protein